MKEQLKNYARLLVEAQDAEAKRNGTTARIDTPKGCCKTLWIPLRSSNRTASIDLNHNIGGFDGNDVLWGYNGNCSTPYAIVPIPANWEKSNIEKLAENVCEKLGKTSGFRVLKADGRLRHIIDMICQMAGKEWSDEVIGNVSELDLTSSELKEKQMDRENTLKVISASKRDAETGLSYMNEKEWLRLRSELHAYPDNHHFNGVIGIREKEQYVLKSAFGYRIQNHLKRSEQGEKVQTVDFYEEQWVEGKGNEVTHHIIIIQK